MFYLVARCYDREHNFNLSSQYYTKAITINPNNPTYYLNLGVSFYNLKQYQKALVNFNKGIHINKADRFNEAILTFNTGIALVNTDSSLHNNKGVSYFKLKQYQKAIDCYYDKAISLNLNDPLPVNNKAIALKKLHTLETALAKIEEDIESQPDNSSLYVNNKANILKQLNKPEEAITVYTKAIDIDNKNKDAFSQRGTALLEIHNNTHNGSKEKLKNALNDFNNVIS